MLPIISIKGNDWILNIKSFGIYIISSEEVASIFVGKDNMDVRFKNNSEKLFILLTEKEANEIRQFIMKELSK